MAVALVLSCVAVLLATSVLAVGLAPPGRPIVYGAGLVVSLVSFGAALNVLLGGSAGSVSLPLGLPWLGAHFRIDALAAFFLVVVNLGGAAASLFALG
jgi:hydrogenase-4 component B